MLNTSGSKANDSLVWGHWLENLQSEVEEENNAYLQMANILKWYQKHLKMKIVQNCEISDMPSKNLDNYFKLEENIKRAELEHKSSLRKIRYGKGVEMIKMLYEKILSLDHHFSSLQTHQNVEMLTNPNHYPAFQQARENGKRGKKKGVELPPLLNSNPYVSIAAYLVNVFNFKQSDKEKEDNLEQVSCIMDFTLEMQNDLKTIYYDTEFLRSGLASLKSECERLFQEYSAVVGYDTNLQDCRQADKWEELAKYTDIYIGDLDEFILAGDPESDREVYRMQSDLDFAIDRLLGFITDYNLFVAQGEKYYAKFQTIIENYRNLDICVEYLPHSFDALKKDIKSSMEKFEAAYDIAELKGSRLKEVMYGRLD